MNGYVLPKCVLLQKEVYSLCARHCSLCLHTSGHLILTTSLWVNGQMRKQRRREVNWLGPRPTAPSDVNRGSPPRDFAPSLSICIIFLSVFFFLFLFNNIPWTSSSLSANKSMAHRLNGTQKQKGIVQHSFVGTSCPWLKQNFQGRKVRETLWFWKSLLSKMLQTSASVRPIQIFKRRWK